MNIPDKLWSEAEKRGLDWISTGGGCDFIYREIGKVELVLGCVESHECPDSLSEPCFVSIYVDDKEWSGTLVESFTSVTKALDWMKEYEVDDEIHDLLDHAANEASGTAYDCVTDRLSLIRERPKWERDKEEEAALERCLEWLRKEAS
tara:strand:+ start:1214 stop:1657 length:444 start_codon:yes stop_codon:yes gene_type:complete